MFCVIYQWRVKKDQEERFRELWRKGTEAVYRSEGSFGSRMHQSDDGSWIAYAQWPDRETWEKGVKALADIVAAADWEECLEDDGQTLHKLTVTDDLLRSVPFAESGSSVPAKTT